MSTSIDKPVENAQGVGELLASAPSASLRPQGEEQKECDTEVAANIVTSSDDKPKEEPAEKSLSSSEAKTLAECEDRIHGANLSFLQAGKALETISVQRLYRERHKTFNGYCKERWGFTPQRADQLIRASEVATAINDSDPNGKLPKPESEGQLRPLTRLADMSEAPLVWEQAAELAKGKRITARLLADTMCDLGCELSTPAKAPPKSPTPKQVVKRISDFADGLRRKVDALDPQAMSPDDNESLRQGIAVLRGLIKEIADKLPDLSQEDPVVEGTDAMST
ncbi:MAG: hypothetical protein KDN19_18645 [Verrucomicrobiae bacterium]|nr:hypothetical protein [Verrucomicrobiae bacterium]